MCSGCGHRAQSPRQFGESRSLFAISPEGTTARQACQEAQGKSACCQAQGRQGEACKGKQNYLCPQDAGIYWTLLSDGHGTGPHGPPGCLPFCQSRVSQLLFTEYLLCARARPNAGDTMVSKAAPGSLPPRTFCCQSQLDIKICKPRNLNLSWTKWRED